MLFYIRQKRFTKLYEDKVREYSQTMNYYKADVEASKYIKTVLETEKKIQE